MVGVGDGGIRVGRGQGEGWNVFLSGTAHFTNLQDVQSMSETVIDSVELSR